LPICHKATGAPSNFLTTFRQPFLPPAENGKRGHLRRKFIYFY
jgi:hypothetical protein